MLITFMWCTHSCNQTSRQIATLININFSLVKRKEIQSSRPMDLSAPTSKVHQNLTDFKIHKSGKSFDNIHKLNQQVSTLSKNLKVLPIENSLTFSHRGFQSTKVFKKIISCQCQLMKQNTYDFSNMVRKSQW